MASHVTPEYSHAYYIRHRERILARVQQYREANHDRLRIEHRRRYWANRTERLKQCRVYKLNRPAWHRSLAAARERCNNPHNRSYRHYGARGIRCLLTLTEVKVLAARDHTEGMKYPTLDRINPKGHYTLNNCQFMERAANTAKSWRDTPIRRWRGGD